MRITQKELGSSKRAISGKRLSALVMLAAMLMQMGEAWAQVQHVPPPAGSSNVNLHSTHATHTVTGLGQSQSVNLNVGGVTQTITSVSHVTAAEQVALTQVLNTGHQSIILNALGGAIGGTVNLATDVKTSINNLVIPRGVTVVDQISSSNSLKLLGNLVNFGQIYAVSTNSAFQSANISATNIRNQQGALISSVLPQGGLSGINSVVSNLNLNLNAINNIMNAGAITSSGNLALSAGGSITNALPSGAAGASPLLQAAGNINMVANSIANAGAINALAGNVNVQAMQGSSLAFNNAGGTISALAGDINIGDPTSTLKTDLNISGGNFLSHNLNLYSGNGAINVDVDNVTGRVNAYGGEANVTAATPNLIIGEMQLTGDPNYYNTTGDVTIGQGLTFNGTNLALVAFGNILTTTGAGTIDTHDTSGSGNGGTINLIAGAAFTINSGGQSSQPSAGNTGTNNIITITGASSGGGKIDLTGSAPISTFNSSTTASGKTGGNIQLIAFGGTTSGSGTITLPSTLILQSGGGSGGSAGTVTMIAGAGSGTGISVGGVNTSGSATSGGTITLATATPTANSVSFNNGALSGSFSANTSLQPASIVVGSAITGNGQAINIKSGGNLSIASSITNTGNNGTGSNTLLNLLAASGTITFSGGGTISDNGTATNTVTGGGITINSQAIVVNGGTETISSNGNGTANGGVMSITASGLTSDLTVGAGALVISATGGSAGNTGTGGNVTMVAGRNLTVTPGSLTVGPIGSGGGGAIINLRAGAAGSGNLFITGSLMENGSGSSFPNSGGSITLTTNSSTPFTIGSGAGTNGVNGTLSANGGTGSSATGGTLLVTNTGSGGIYVPSPSSLTVTPGSGATGGSITLTAYNGPLVFGTGTLTNENGSANATGGSINLTGVSLAVISGPLTLNTSSTGTVGSIGVTVTGAGSSLSVANAANSLIIQATGNQQSVCPTCTQQTVVLTAGQNVSVTTGSSTFNIAAAGTASNGPGIKLVAGQSGSGNLLVNGAINASSTGTGEGGAITLVMNSSTVFTVDGSASLNGNGVQGALSANVTTTTGSSNTGGSISVTNYGSGGISIPAISNISVTPGASGNGGSVTLNANSGPLSLGTGTISTAAGTSSTFGESGGNITIAGSSITIGTVVNPGTLTLTSNGIQGGSAGNISVTASGGSSNLAVGTANGDLIINAQGTSFFTCSGCTPLVSLIAGQNLTINTGSLNTTFNTPTGTNSYGFGLTFTAGGNLQITGSLNVSGQTTAGGNTTVQGGFINFTSNSSSPFTVDPSLANAPTNGINGTLTASSPNGQAGGITILNTGSGGISIPAPGTSLVLTANTGGTGTGGAGGIIKWDPLESTCRHASLSIL